MAQAVISFRVDETLKKRMEATCKNMGLSMSAAFTLFATKVTREQRIPFEISYEAEPFHTKENLDYVKKSVAELRAGKGKAHELLEVDDE